MLYHFLAGTSASISVSVLSQQYESNHNRLPISIKQERNIDLLDLNKIYKNNLSFTDKEINNYYDKNKDLFKDTYIN